jgi:hypothetical protein
MKAWGWSAVVLMLGTMAQADSLGELATRERERREKQKQQQGTSVETRVIRDEDLAAAAGKDAKGTFNPGSGFASGRPTASPSPSPSSPPGSTGSVTEVDATRSAARQRLETSYQRISEMAQSLMQAVQHYQSQRCEDMPRSDCQGLLIVIGRLAISIGITMDDAEEAARQGWLNPGEVRAMRQRYGMDDANWDKLVRLVHTYRR